MITRNDRQRYSLVLIMLVLVGLPTAVRAADDKTKQPTVVMTIDYGDGVQKVFSQLKWSKGMTILKLLEAAKKHPRGIDFKHRGSGANGFLTQIDDLKNEGRGSNWIYRVNDELGSKSFAIYELERGDTVLWKFGEYR